MNFHKPIIIGIITSLTFIAWGIIQLNNFLILAGLGLLLTGLTALWEINKE